MSWDVLLWAVLWSAASWWLGYRFGVRETIRRVARVMVEIGIWPAYVEASDRWHRNQP